MAICGICCALVMAATAPVLAVSEGPMIALTFSLKIRFSALLLAMSALEPSSSIRILSGRPLMPPLSLIDFLGELDAAALGLAEARAGSGEREHGADLDGFLRLRCSNERQQRERDAQRTHGKARAGSPAGGRIPSSSKVGCWYFFLNLCLYFLL